MIKDFEIIPDPLENSGENCWTACHENPGKCDWCGTEGLCCRKGFKVNECDGLAGVESEHQCILKGKYIQIKCIKYAVCMRVHC